MRLTATRTSITSGGGAVLDAIQQEDPTLDFQFSENKTLTNDVDDTNLITFTRASSGTYVDSNGLIQSAAVDTPRFDHDPSTGESLGLLIEEARTNLLTESEDVSGYILKNVTTPFDSSAVNPTGSLGSYKINANSGSATGGTVIRFATTSGNNIVVSAFVKKSTYRYALVGFGGSTNSFTALFDIEPGLTSNRLLGQGKRGTSTNISAGYQDFPNDWIRIWAVGTTTGGGPSVGMSEDASTFVIKNWTAAGTEEIYVWGLQYEDNVTFPTSYIPTSGSTVTRAAEIAEISGNKFSKTNLLQYSEEFDQLTQTNLSVTPNAIIAPNGKLTGDKLVLTTAGHAHVEVYTTQISSINVYGYVDLTTGVLTTEAGSLNGSTVTDVGNGWWRIAVTSGSNYTLSFYAKKGGANYATWQLHTNARIGVSDTASIFNTSGSGDIYVWGAQLEEGDELTEYTSSVESFVSRASTATYYDANGIIQTAAVDEARTAAYLPDENGNFISAGELLLEEARTNKIAQSRNVSSNYWTKNNMNVGLASTTDPFGNSTVYRIKATTVNDRHSFHRNSSVVSANTDHTFSAFAAPQGTGSDSGKIQLRVFSVGDTSAIVNFDLNTGQYNAHDGTSGTSSQGKIWSISDYGMEPHTGGWYRVWMTFQINDVASIGILTIDDINADDVGSMYKYSGSGTGGSFITGIQLEEGSFKTSAIFTSGSTVTRAADVSTSALGVDSFYNQSEGTIFSDSVTTEGTAFTYSMHDGSNLNRLVFNSGTNIGRPLVEISGTSNSFGTAPTSVAGGGLVAFGYKASDYAAYGDGSALNGSSPASVPTGLNELAIGFRGTHQPDLYLNGHVKRLAYFKTRLPNTTLQTITT